MEKAQFMKLVVTKCYPLSCCFLYPTYICKYIRQHLIENLKFWCVEGFDCYHFVTMRSSLGFDERSNDLNLNFPYAVY